MTVSIGKIDNVRNANLLQHLFILRDQQVTNVETWHDFIYH